MIPYMFNFCDKYNIIASWISLNKIYEILGLNNKEI